MPKPTKGPRLGSGPTHQRHIIRGLAASLIVEERIRTSEAKAKVLKQYADKLVTLGKTDTIHARRQALQVIEDSDVVHKLFAEIAPRFAERNGGYTRILKLGPRKGDAAPMAIIEFVEDTVADKAEKADEEGGKRRGLRRRKKDEEEAPAKPPRATRSRAAKTAEGTEEDEAEPEPAPQAAAEPAPDAEAGEPEETTETGESEE